MTNSNTSKASTIIRWAPKISLFAVLMISLCFSVTYLSYKDPRYDYSMFNHFISELGHTEGSPYYYLFSIALCFGGIGCGVLLVALHFLIRSKWSTAACVVGMIASIACFFVGVFPADTHLKPHLLAALLFFVGNLLTAFLFSVAMVKSKQRIPFQYAFSGFVVFLVGVIFLSLPTESVKEFLKNRDVYIRPDFWWNAVMEWMVFFSLMVWIIMISYWVYQKRNQTTS